MSTEEKLQYKRKFKKKKYFVRDLNATPQKAGRNHFS
jgi:hypothetical protein